MTFTEKVIEYMEKGINPKVPVVVLDSYELILDWLELEIFIKQERN